MTRGWMGDVSGGDWGPDDGPDEPEGCVGCGALAGCCKDYPNCVGNPEWKPTQDPTDGAK